MYDDMHVGHKLVHDPMFTVASMFKQMQECLVRLCSEQQDLLFGYRSKLWL